MLITPLDELDYYWIDNNSTQIKSIYDEWNIKLLLIILIYIISLIILGIFLRYIFEIVKVKIRKIIKAKIRDQENIV